MAWTPISGTMTQYSTSANALASSYYLKFYQSGTTTAFNMATDSAGGTTLDKCQLDSSGYPTTDGTTRFIPHVNQKYKIVLYKNATDADADTVGNSDWVIDAIEQVQTGDTDAWVLFSGTPTQTSATTFTITGDQTSTFTVGTRLKFDDSSTLYGNVTVSAYTTLTTVTVVLDSGSLSGSLSTVYTSIADTVSEPIGSASVNYLPSGTGAIATNVQAKLREIVSVKDFGAIGDGVNDDTAAIQAALDYISNLTNLAVPLESTTYAGAVYFPPGAYKVSSTLSVYDRTTLYGDGDRLVYIDGATISAAPVIKSSRYGSGSVNQFIDIKDLTIYGDSSGGSNDGIQFAVFGGNIEGVQVKNCGVGIYIGSTGNSNTLVETHVNNCKIHECTNGIRGAASAKATDIKVSNSTINACSNACILSESSGGWQVWGNNFYNADYLIRFVTTVASNTITGNYMGEANKAPIYYEFGGSSGSGAQSITGNVFKTANNSAGASIDADKAVISMVNNGAASDGEGIVINGNVIRDTTGNALFGIRLSGLFSKTVIGPNAYDGSFTNNIKFPTTKTGISVMEPQLDLYATQTTPSTVTIATGDISISANTHYVDTEGAASTDDLFTISGDVFAGQNLTLYAADSARTVVVKDSTLKLNGDFSLDNAEDSITLHYDGTTWREISRTDSGA